MIKNILYSLFIHFILFSAIYFAFIKKNNKEIEAEQEILVSVITLDNKGVPPINESMQQPQEKPKSAEKKEEKTEAPSEKNDKPEEPKKIKKEIETKEKSPKKIIKKPQKEETKATENNKQETTKLDQKENDKDFFKVMNLKAFKNITDDVKGSTLSIRETINIQSQLKLCYRRALEESGFESKTKIVIRIEISQDGYIQNDLDEMVDIEKYNDPVYKDYKIVIDNIKRALDLCSPLRNLPIEKYDSWKEIILQFDVGKDAN
jgi:outer membrane biosynthesis protein TonB